MNLNEIIIQLCRLKECEDIPIKYKADLQEIVHSLNYIQIGQTLGLDAEDVRARMLQTKEPNPIWDKWIAMANGEME